MVGMNAIWRRKRGAELARFEQNVLLSLFIENFRALARHTNRSKLRYLENLAE